MTRDRTKWRFEGQGAQRAAPQQRCHRRALVHPAGVQDGCGWDADPGGTSSQHPVASICHSTTTRAGCVVCRVYVRASLLLPLGARACARDTRVVREPPPPFLALPQPHSHTEASQRHTTHAARSQAVRAVDARAHTKHGASARLWWREPVARAPLARQSARPTRRARRRRRRRGRKKVSKININFYYQQILPPTGEACGPEKSV